MPAPAIHEYWRERVKSYLAKDDAARRRPSPTAIHRHLLVEEEGMERLKSAEVGKPPSPRSIDRIRVGEWESKTLEEKIEYQDLSWPESMERGDLPWEASAAALELLGALAARCDPECARRVRSLQWRITLSPRFAWLWLQSWWHGWLGSPAPVEPPDPEPVRADWP